MNAIDVCNVSKVYRLYRKPSDRLKEALLRRAFHEPFRPLSDISFSLPRGGTLGIIGENGAGKSTLLKILAGTLSPTSGEVHCRGRVAALLELGAGFHPEFTGRQNIRLNAALLGLGSDEIGAREQDIIDFSELAGFIDRPVKTYSSGMKMRLGFSVATSVDPDILIVDEALSVGDQRFQKKCINRMMDFRARGKTILFCSHSMYLIQQLCDRGLWLTKGRMGRLGEVREVVNAYTESVQSAAETSATAAEAAAPTEHKPVWIKGAEVVDARGQTADRFDTGADLCLRLRIGVAHGEAGEYRGGVGIAVERSDRLPIFGATTLRDGLAPVGFEDDMEISVDLPATQLLSGSYYFLVVLTDEHGVHIYDKQRSANFTLRHGGGEAGIVSLAHVWRLPQ